jgi:alkylation response protein AidB-like acyl-CoA dehydrogenase
MDDAWRAASAGAEVTLAQRVQLRLAITNAVQSAKEAVALLYEAAGGAAIYATSPLERCFRDIHVATQHAIVATPSYELFGRALLGLEVDASAVL